LLDFTAFKTSSKGIPEKELATFEEAGACATEALINRIRIDGLRFCKHFF
jgi:hypothetical protein